MDGVVPHGQSEGLICLDVDYSDLTPGNSESLTNWVLRKRKPGQTIVRLLGDVPWGTLDLDRMIYRFQSDPRLTHVRLWTTRECRDEHWPSANVWTVLDISYLFGPEPAIEQKRNLNDLPLLPRPDELLIRTSHRNSLSPDFLDEVASRLDPDAAWVYTQDPETYDRARKVLQRTFSTWGLRYG